MSARVALLRLIHLMEHPVGKEHPCQQPHSVDRITLTGNEVVKTSQELVIWSASTSGSGLGGSNGNALYLVTVPLPLLSNYSLIFVIVGRQYTSGGMCSILN